MKCETLQERQPKQNSLTPTECKGSSELGSKFKHLLPRIKLYYQFERIN